MIRDRFIPTPLEKNTTAKGVALETAVFFIDFLHARLITRQEIYDRLWPGEMSYDGKNKPYEQQISDYKRKFIARIRKGIAGKFTAETNELKTLMTVAGVSLHEI